MELAEGAVLRNTGTFNSNTGYSAAIIAGSGSSSIVNTGTFQKTSNIANTIEPGFENKGAVISTHQTLSFSGGGTTTAGSSWEGEGGGKLQFSAGTFSMSAGTLGRGGLGERHRHGNPRRGKRYESRLRSRRGNPKRP